MTLIQAIILGIVQGATEFLPISSSGHLVLVPWIAGWELDPQAAFVFDVLVQWGTLVAVFAYFWKDIVTMVTAAIKGVFSGKPFADPYARLAWLLVVSSIPAAAAGLLLKNLVVDSFTNPGLVSGFLLLTAALLFISDALGKQQRKMDSVTWKDALWIGASQVLALFPGVSRSGSTIAGGLLRGFNRMEAARFSFLMSIPVMLGAGGIAILDLLEAPDTLSQLPNVAAGFFAAAIVGYLSIRWLLQFLGNNTFKGFAIYCALLGSAGILFYVVT